MTLMIGGPRNPKGSVHEKREAWTHEVGTSPESRRALLTGKDGEVPATWKGWAARGRTVLPCVFCKAPRPLQRAVLHSDPMTLFSGSC